MTRVCLRCQRAAGRYRCPKCGQWFCFAHCAGHGCERPATWREMPVLPPDVGLPQIMLSHWWDHLSVALYSAGSLYLHDSANARCIALFVPSAYAPTLYCTCKVVRIGTPPSVIAAGQEETLGKLMLTMPEEYQQILPDLLKELADHEYNATIPPDATMEDAP